MLIVFNNFRRCSPDRTTAERNIRRRRRRHERVAPTCLQLRQHERSTFTVEAAGNVSTVETTGCVSTVQHRRNHGGSSARHANSWGLHTQKTNGNTVWSSCELFPWRALCGTEKQNNLSKSVGYLRVKNEQKKSEKIWSVSQKSMMFSDIPTITLIIKSKTLLASKKINTVLIRPLIMTLIGFMLNSIDYRRKIFHGVSWEMDVSSCFLESRPELLKGRSIILIRYSCKTLAADFTPGLRTNFFLNLCF